MISSLASFTSFYSHKLMPLDIIKYDESLTAVLHIFGYFLLTMFSFTFLFLHMHVE